VNPVREHDGGHGRGHESLRRIVFWQPIVSPHQRDFLEQLAAAFPGEIILAAERYLPEERIAQGWMPVSHDRVRVVDVSDRQAFGLLVGHRADDSLHVFSGFFSHRIVWRAFHVLADSRARLAMLSEAPEQRPWTGWLKTWRGRWLAWRFGDRLEFVLGMGTLGRDFFRTVGFPGKKVHAFGYHLPVPSEPWPRSLSPVAGPFRFIAAGQFIHRKGFDLLVAALATLEPTGWHCDLYGAGPLEGALRRQILLAGLHDRVTLHPTLPNGPMRSEIAASDCSVVPSRHDGWGVVVNESLIAGTPVVCTSGCGAASLVEGTVGGFVVPRGDSTTLARVLRQCLAAGKIDSVRRRQVHAVAGRSGPETAVRAFLRIVENRSFPTPPP